MKFYRVYIETIHYEQYTLKNKYGVGSLFSSNVTVKTNFKNVQQIFIDVRNSLKLETNPFYNSVTHKTVIKLIQTDENEGHV